MRNFITNFLRALSVVTVMFMIFGAVAGIGYLLIKIFSVLGMLIGFGLIVSIILAAFWTYMDRD